MHGQTNGPGRSVKAGAYLGQVEENAADFALLRPPDLAAKIMTVDGHTNEIARFEGLGAAQPEPAAGNVEQMCGMALAMIVEQQAVAPNRNARSAP